MHAVSHHQRTTSTLVLHGDSSRRLATPRNTKDKKHDPGAALLQCFLSATCNRFGNYSVSPAVVDAVHVMWLGRWAQVAAVPVLRLSIARYRGALCVCGALAGVFGGLFVTD